jgi:murein DD-endopeptidase MepM/ murein hydrolase activator NlpD
VANYNSLRREVDSLRAKYQELQTVTNQKNEQLATLETFASEVSVAYGLKSKPEASTDVSSGALAPTFRESLGQYNFLQSASISKLYRAYPKQWQTNIRPSLWPVEGRLMSAFGGRTDPFSGEGAIHTGVDLSAPQGTSVHCAADGIVIHAEWSTGGYGRLVVVDHGNGLQTYYGHLSRFEVVSGQEVRRGDIIGQSGSSGRATSPHLHYEVRMGGTPVNPYPYLARSALSLPKHGARDLPF